MLRIRLKKITAMDDPKKYFGNFPSEFDRGAASSSSKEIFGQSWLSGCVCADHHNVQGSNLKHTIFAFMVKFCTIFVIVLKKGQKGKLNEAGLGQYLKNISSYHLKVNKCNILPIYH